jgi:hypothetical protein
MGAKYMTALAATSSPSNAHRSLETSTTEQLSTVEPGPPWLPDLAARLQQLLQLQAGWDSYAAKRPSPMNADAVLDMIRGLNLPQLPLPNVVPTVEGGFQLEWFMGDHELEIEVVTPFLLKACYENVRTGEVWEDEAINNFAGLSARAARLGAPQASG